MIGTHVRRVAKINVSADFPRHGLDARIFLLQPLLNESFVALFRAMKRLLTSDPKLREKPAHRHGAQLYTELVLDQLSHHLARPQREHEFQLQRVLARHRIVNPLHLFAVEFRWAPAQRLGFQPIPAALAIARQPAVDSGAIQVESLRQNFWAFTICT